MSRSFCNLDNLDKVEWRVNDSPDHYSLMLCCSGTIKIMPRINVCNDYHVPVTVKQAEWFLRTRCNMVVNLNNITTVFDTNILCRSYARRVQAMMTEILVNPYNRRKYKILSYNNGYEIYKESISKLIGEKC
jgi:hypothetical protein